jgi:DNA-directed RNA polymerase subunit RPC12/RpoP
MVPDGEKKTYICEKCGSEADLIVKEEHEEEHKKASLVCKVCGSEADTIFEEI